MTHKELKETVAVMRALGVVEFNGITLGPAPYGTHAYEVPEPDPVPEPAPKLTIEEFRKKAGR